jgi:hypothetical protein
MDGGNWGNTSRSSQRASSQITRSRIFAGHRLSAQGLAAGRGFATGDGPKADVYREANEFCTQKNKKVETLKITSQDGKPFVRSGHAELHFRCVRESDAK